MGAVVEEMEFGARNELEEQDSPLDADAAIVLAPQKKTSDF
jgi:hypothetical protein